jgi:hypothetical protein
MLSRCVLAIVAFALSPLAARAASYAADDAVRHVGESATVCGTVDSGSYAARSRGQPTFLDFGGRYPHEAFVALIWGHDRAAFGAPERTLLGKRVCVTGKIERYRGKPEIIVRSPTQLTQD